MSKIVLTNTPIKFWQHSMIIIIHISMIININIINKIKLLISFIYLISLILLNIITIKYY